MAGKAFSELEFPHGGRVSNRLVKAAMEENMAVEGNLPGDAMFRLYQTWAQSGAGALITGNVMVDHLAMTGPGGVALEATTPLEPFRKWAQTAKKGGAQIWMQINHPGRQVYAAMGGKVLSPSDIALDMGKYSKLFGQPKAMSETQIEELIERFGVTARRATEAGFDGVQIHAAHGYLLSQFLSPLTNKRQDQWGGSLENRARVLREVVKRVREAMPGHAVLSVKINSADFQRGGFEANDALETVKSLESLGVDFVEVSGGSYESPAMQGSTADGRTLGREAYFLEFAKTISENTRLPIMTTGGITRLAVAEKVLDTGVDLVGLGRALAFEPTLPADWQRGEQASAQIPAPSWKDKTMTAMAVMALTKSQFRRMGQGKATKATLSPLWSLLQDQLRLKQLTRRYRKRYIA